MKNLFIHLIAAASLALAAGCSKKEDKADESAEESAGDEAAKGAEEQPADDTAGDEAAADDTADDQAAAGDEAAAGDDPVICCEFNGAVGTATKSGCDQGGGKVVADLEPPCTK